MTPALREAATKGHGIHLSPSLSSRAMESDTTLCMENSRAVEETKKEDSITQITCSVLGFPTADLNLSNDIFSVKHFGSPQSTRHYQSVLLMSTNSPLNLKPTNSKQRNSEEHSCSKMRNLLHNGATTQISQTNNSESENQVRGENVSETMSQSLAEMQRLLDSNVTEISNMAFPKCKWYRKNGFLDKALLVHGETKKSNVLHQVEHEPLKPVMSCTPRSKEEELNAHLLEYISRQQVVLSRAKRARKRLQILLAKHVVKHCDHQLKCFVKHQLQRMKVFHDPTRFLDSSSRGCTDIREENSTTNLKNNKDTQNGFNIEPGEMWGFAHSATGLLSHVEKDLDSDATCSSSDEDRDEQTVRKTVEGNYNSEWKWLLNRAKIGYRWTWLQTQISELEYKIQRLTDLHRQIRATKGMVILEEFPLPKDILKKQMQLTNPEVLLNSTGNSQATFERQDSIPEHDFEMSPSSPTLLLRNIEKQSAQLSEIINNLIAPLNMSPTFFPLSSTSCKHKQLVNGVSLRASDNREEMSSSSQLFDHQHIKKRRKDRTRLRSPSETMSTSARTRPLQSFQKRKLYRMSSACCWNKQALPSRDASFPYNTQVPCMAPASIWSSYERDTTSRIVQHIPEMDSTFHPVLSFSSDIPLHIYFETLLKEDKIKGDPVDFSALGVEFKMSPFNEYNQHNASFKQWSSGYLLNSRPQAASKTSELFSEGRKKRHLSETAIGECNSDAFCFRRAEPESHNDFTAVTHVNLMSRATPNTSSQHSSRRRLRSESSYDIDNIVIPMSLVAPSKLEKLQYKEILTPSWRVVELHPLGRFHIDEEEIEDLSDELFSSRHAKYEQREKARWLLWEQSQWPRRNSRSYSKNAEGQRGQDPVMTENHHNSCALLHCAAEAVSDLTSEIHGSACLRVPQSSKENQETKSELWELRVFPLKDEDIETLRCQDQITNQIESSSADFHSDSLCTSCTPISGHPPRKQPAEELDDCKSVFLGLGSTRKHR
uniref:KAT8 regulatory NSL complex subunit 1 like n=1 Tax=Pelodiscus sinensis TaxID=13735 RepID=K7G167_PELSI|nr:KAT8 regulatory NSL complex subunit 1-like protein isoform X1 [Pelodiscus sinensis]XP_025042603.1 KAT8 regulatory NSL complex subunit 1-like protein isoform X1 [Pelodiscus sinensis]|eukprot:XP_025042602.1 KAT8 regulatory NSL complex subunit 1-like protein isoform X1 [Pelodiscus sinensis]